MNARAMHVKSRDRIRFAKYHVIRRAQAQPKLRFRDYLLLSTSIPYLASYNHRQHAGTSTANGELIHIDLLPSADSAATHCGPPEGYADDLHSRSELTFAEGTDTSQGMGQLLSNISACLAIAQTVATTLGPRGMDKLIVDERGNATISSEESTLSQTCPS